MELYNRTKGKICAKERKGILSIKKKKRKSTSIYGESIVKKVYSAIKIATNLTSLFCNKEEQ